MLTRPDGGPHEKQVSRIAGVLRARFARVGGATRLADMHEAGGVRLKLPRGDHCQAVMVNVGGGLTGADRLDVALALDVGAEATFTTQSAEKIYRADGGETAVDARVALGAGAALIWAPQETLLFEGARLRRRLTITMAPDASLTLIESVVFGRLAHGEISADSHVRDSWRVSRGGALLIAEETHVAGARVLDRAALGGGARASATLILVGRHAAPALEPLRALFEARAEDGVEAGVSLIEDRLFARALSRDPARLRSVLREAIIASTGRALPRVWN